MTETRTNGELTRRRFAGRYSRYPDETGRRKAEGGQRLQGQARKGKPGEPLVTIITVCFNSAKTIVQTFRSVRDQTYGNIEYVVVDGASTDNTVDIIAEHEDLIDYYISEPDRGLYHAMNKGLELSQGDYILILNSDDWFNSQAVESLVRALDYSGCDFVAALARYVDESSGTSRVLRSMPFDDSVYFRMPLRHETMLVPAWLYNKVGPYDTKFRITADRDMTARFFEAGATFYEVPRALLNFRTSGLSNSDTSGLARERGALIAKEFSFLDADERALLNDPHAAGPDTFARIAEAHLGTPKFVMAVRALLHDRRRNGGPRWKTDIVDRIGAHDPADWPKVSVILPFYKAADTIARAIDSVLEQSLTEFEIVCVNDFAVDESQAIVDAYVERDGRIRCIENSRNLGLGASRNAGIRAAHGRYIFHLDPDDTIPPDALRMLYEAAIEHGSDMIKGAYEDGQRTHQRQKAAIKVKFPCGISDRVVPNTNLIETPRLLSKTGGHWSILYDAVFARRVPYPTDLKMGQDSIFLVKAMVQAQKITLLPEVVYRYQANPNSVMNRFNAPKFFDALEWRRRAWYILRDASHHKLANWILFGYWSNYFFKALDSTLSRDELAQFNEKLGNVLLEAGYNDHAIDLRPGLRRRFATALDAARGIPDGTLRVATFSTRDTGEAAVCSLRRVEALRRAGVDAGIYSVFQSSDRPFVHQLPIVAPPPGGNGLYERWQEASVVSRAACPGLSARDLFSKPGSVVDFDAAAGIVEAADIIHLHWVVGLVDLDRIDVIAEKPVIWTLADMNAFTGGCHYSEGCKGFTADCRHCPLLPAKSDLAYRGWLAKKKAYARIPNLHIVCPSQWLADLVAESSLFGDRPVHVIANALPTDRFLPTNKLVARQKLGLPLDKKLILFGANHTGNKRKGGDLLQQAITQLKSRCPVTEVEGVFLGSSDLEVAISTHNMGHVSDEQRISLIYAAADVFAFPSREDNAPMTVAEVLLSGTPVVSFPVGNIPELVEHRRTGFIARYENIPEFVDGLVWALNPPTTREARLRGLQGCDRARQHNNPKRAVARHLALYATAMEAHRARVATEA